MCKSNAVLGTDPIIREVNKNDLNECLEVIHQSFSTVAEQFGLTKENCQKHTSFTTLLCYRSTETRSLVNCFLITQRML